MWAFGIYNNNNNAVDDIDAVDDDAGYDNDSDGAYDDDYDEAVEILREVWHIPSMRDRTGRF